MIEKIHHHEHAKHYEVGVFPKNGEPWKFGRTFAAGRAEEVAALLSLSEQVEEVWLFLVADRKARKAGAR